MPQLYICRAAGCGATIPHKGYCELHKHLEKDYSKGNKSYSKWHPLYQSAEWKRLRKETLERNNYECSICGSVDKSNVVDHITPHDGDIYLFLDPNNLQVLCSRCHGIKTSKESREKANRRRGI